MVLAFRSALIILHLSWMFILKTTCLDPNLPINAVTYAGKMAQGFSTNWFKYEDHLMKYNSNNAIDVYAAGFRNLKLRCNAELYTAPYDDDTFKAFLDDLETVVDDCLAAGIYPVVSYMHETFEAYATDDDLSNFVRWWNKVARRLQNKDYRLSFNLFNELNNRKCKSTGNCDGSLRNDIDKYNLWTKRGFNNIRRRGGNNDKRLIILTSPEKTASGLSLINEEIYHGDDYAMAEYHLYYTGPNKDPDSPKYWVGEGNDEQRKTLYDEVETAKNAIAIPTYFGGWMPWDNANGEVHQPGVENFAKFFVSVMKNYTTPWSLNVLDRFYDTKEATWRTDRQEIAGEPLRLDDVLAVIKENM